jgi:hypothetical protein
LLRVLDVAIGWRNQSIPSSAGIGEAIAEMVSLEGEESDVDKQLRHLRSRLEEMSKLQENASRYRDSLTVQRDRLHVAKWLRSIEDPSHNCPICDTPLTLETPKLEQLLESLARVDEEMKRVGVIPASFDREMFRVKEETDLCIEKLKGIGIRKAMVEARSVEVRQSRSRETEISRFLGRVERVVEMQKVLGQDSALAEEVESLRRTAEHLEKLISRANVAARQKRALEKVEMFPSRILPSLDAERPDDPIRLSLTDLTMKVVGKTRGDYLWEIGSGANWLSYHVAVSLALQQFFLESAPSPVPSFLVFDQPSQVYFPRRLAGARTEEDLDPKFDDEDILAVRKVFLVLADVVRQAKGGLQVLVLDHAGTDVWGGIEYVELVQEWRDGRKLVPIEWLS